jgi:hypothetical protein
MFETSSHLMATNTWHRLFLQWAGSVRRTEGQMLKYQCWLPGGLACTICYPCALRIYIYSMPPHVHIDFVVPPGCGQSVTDFWSLGAHRAWLHCPDDVSDDDMYQRGVPEWAVNLLQASQTMVTVGIFPCKGKFSRQNRVSNPGPHS